MRELSHVIERAVLWSRGTTLDVEHLSLGTPSAPPAASGPTATAAGAPVPQGTSGAVSSPAATGDSASFPPPGMPLDQWERTLIEQALREANGNQTRAAQRLGISRDTLRYRLKKHGLQGQ